MTTDDLVAMVSSISSKLKLRKEVVQHCFTRFEICITRLHDVTNHNNGRSRKLTQSSTFNQKFENSLHNQAEYYIQSKFHRF